MQVPACFKTDMVKDVLTEYDSLKKELDAQNSKLKEKDELLQNYEKRENARIAKENEDKLKPRKGFTYMQLKMDKQEKTVNNYSSLVENYTHKAHPFQDHQNFFATLDRINENKIKDIKFNRESSHLLESEALVQRIPHKDKETKLANFSCGDQ